MGKIKSAEILTAYVCTLVVTGEAFEVAFLALGMSRSSGLAGGGDEADASRGRGSDGSVDDALGLAAAGEECAEHG